MSGLFCLGLALSSAAMAEPLVVELTTVSPGMDEQNHLYVVFQMTPESAKRFAEFTTQNVGRPMEVRIDGKVVMTPVVREPVLGGQAQISDSTWTPRQTKDMADRLQAGMSKIEFEIVKE